jgi:hypothetical protein
VGWKIVVAAVTTITPLRPPESKKAETQCAPVARIDRQKRNCSLLSNWAHSSKLLVAGSIPVSRSMFSIS